MAENLEVFWGKTLVVLDIDGVTIPFENFSYRVNTPAEPIHLPSRYHAGWHYLPPRFTCNFQVMQVHDVGDLLLSKQLARTEVQWVLANIQGDEWTFNYLGMSRCLVLDVNGTNHTARERASFQVSMEALQFFYDPAFTAGAGA